VLGFSGSRALNDQLLKLRNAPLQEFSFRSFLLGGVQVDLRSDDPLLAAEVARTLGEAAARDLPVTALSAVFRSGNSDSDHGLLEINAGDHDALSPEDLLLGLESPSFPFGLSTPIEEGWTSFSFLGDPRPLLSFRGPECLVSKRDRWRAAVGFLLLHRVYRLRRDAIFFHSSSVALGGGGVMFVGPKGAGKSTTALALAARGVPLLGDEIACYRPADGMLEPFRRPVGIKPGPRSMVVDASLRRRGIEIADVVRIDVQRVLDSAVEAEPVPLRRIVFLEPFGEEPRLTAVERIRDDIALLQPVVSSLVNAPRTLRVFQMARMISSAKIYRLSPGDPDSTAELIRREFGGTCP